MFIDGLFRVVEKIAEAGDNQAAVYRVREVDWRSANHATTDKLNGREITAIRPMETGPNAIRPLVPQRGCFPLSPTTAADTGEVIYLITC